MLSSPLADGASTASAIVRLCLRQASLNEDHGADARAFTVLLHRVRDTPPAGGVNSRGAGCRSAPPCGYVLVSLSSRAAWGIHPVRSIEGHNFPRRAFPVCCCAGAIGAATVRQVIAARRALGVPGTSDAGWSDGIKDIAPYAFVTHFVPSACNLV